MGRTGVSGRGGATDAYSFEDADVDERLLRSGKTLLSKLGGKDQTLKALKVDWPLSRGNQRSSREARGCDACQASLTPAPLPSYRTQHAAAALEEAPQSSDSGKRAARDLARALARKELLHHRDKVGAGRCCSGRQPPFARSSAWRIWRHTFFLSTQHWVVGGPPLRCTLSIPPPAPVCTRHALRKRRAGGASGPGRCPARSARCHDAWPTLNCIMPCSSPVSAAPILLS